jgi:ATP synthase protein I
MTTMPPVESKATQQDEYETEAQESDFTPLTREEAQRWRASQPVFSVWRLVGVQLLAGLAASALSWLFTQSAPLAWSVLYGAASVVIPSAVMAYGLTASALTRLMSGFAQAAFVGLLLWEGVKVVLVIAMLWLAPTVVPELNWLGLLAGLVVVLKVYWLGLWTHTRRSN